MEKEYALGKWDLSGLAPSHGSAMFEQRLEEIDGEVFCFEKKRSSLRNDISSKVLYDILHLYEEIVEDTSRIGHYAHLLFSSDTSNPKALSLVARIDNINAKIANRTMFLELWWKKGIDQKNAERLLKDAGNLENYLTRQRKLAKYTLTEPEEKIINIKDTTGVGFIHKLYDQYTERFVFHITLDGKRKQLKKPELTALFHSPDPKKRRGAYRSLLKVYRQNEDVLGELYRSVVMDWKNEAVDLRGYKSPISVRNILNDIPDEAVDTLLQVCRENRDVFQRYFRQKAKMLGMRRMSRYHIYAPIDTSEVSYSFSDGVKLVLNSIRDFSPKMALLAEKVLDETHLDSELRRGKRGGAFCATASPKITPFVLANYTGKQRDVFTLAHELGHAVHSQLAADKSILVQQAPLPLAELASVFSEMMLLDNLLETDSEEEKRRLIARELDGFYATIMRQAYFTIFERDAHDAFTKAATVSEVSDIYSRNLEEQFGKAVKVTEEFKHEWTYIPHFYHTPFYTYAYSFGNLLTVSLYQMYKKEGNKFVGEYINILSAGGSKNPESLLKEAGIDIRSEEGWQGGFDYIKERTQELERLNN